MPKLTKRAVDALTPGPQGRDVFLWDDALAGFGVRVRPSGRKTYVVQYRDAGGRTRRVIVGEHGPMTPDEARSAAASVRAAALEARRDADKLDPAAKRTRARQVARAAHAAPTIAELADIFLAECAAKLKPSTVAGYRYLLGLTPVKVGPAKGSERVGPLRAALGARKVADVTAADVARLHLAARTTPYAANRALALLSTFFAFAERQGVRPRGSNPCADIAPYREHRRERYLTDAEFAAVGAALERAERVGLPQPPTTRTAKRRKATAATTKHRTKDTTADGARAPRPASPIAVAALRFLLLTGWRESEALGLTWRQLDTARGLATLEDSKTGRSVRDLGSAALEVLEAARAWQRVDNPHVFPGTNPGAPLTGVGKIWDAVRHAAGVPDVRLHDVRHAFASVGASGGLTLPIIGALLGHADASTTARYAHLAGSTRKRAADAVAAHVAAALSGTRGVDGRRSETGGDAVVLPFVRGA